MPLVKAGRIIEDRFVRVLDDAPGCDPAGELVAKLLELAERYGFDFWQMFGATERCLVDSSVLLSCGDPDPATLETQIATMTGFVEFWRSVGLYAYQTEYDCVLGRLLTAAGRPDEARARVDIALQIARDTGMHYTTLNCCAREPTPTPTPTPAPPTSPPPSSWPAAKARRYSNCAQP